jgi:hypothetical protein
MRQETTTHRGIRQPKQTPGRLLQTRVASVAAALAIAAGCAPATASVQPPLGQTPLLAAVDWTPESAVLRFFDPDGRAQPAIRVLEGASSGTRAKASPSSGAIAYTYLDSFGADPGADGRIGLIDLRTGDTTVIAEGVDIRSAPVFSPNGQAIAYRKRVAAATGDYDQIWIRRIGAGESEMAVSDRGSFGLFPVQWTDSGLTYMSISLGGSFLHIPMSAPLH